LEIYLYDGMRTAPALLELLPLELPFKAEDQMGHTLWLDVGLIALSFSFELIAMVGFEARCSNSTAEVDVTSDVDTDSTLLNVDFTRLTALVSVVLG
jgi:hypothetical protein